MISLRMVGGGDLLYKEIIATPRPALDLARRGISQIGTDYLADDPFKYVQLSFEGWVL